MNKEVLLAVEHIKNARNQIASAHAIEAMLGDKSDYWDVYDSSSLDYDRTFGPISRNRSLVDILRATKEPVVVDFLASTALVREMIGSYGINDQPAKPLGIAVGLRDQRTTEEREVDCALNVHYVSGNIFNLDTWGEIEKKLDGKKASLIVERGLGALTDMPRNPVLFRDIVCKLWDMLSSDNGEMFLQFPNVAELTDYVEDLMSWQGLLIESGIDCTFSYGLMPMGRISKQKTSPENLPFLKLSQLTMPYND